MYKIKAGYSYEKLIENLRKTPGYIHLGETEPVNGVSYDIFLTPFGPILVYKLETRENSKIWKIHIEKIDIENIRITIKTEEEEEEEDDDGGDKYEDR